MPHCHLNALANLLNFNLHVHDSTLIDLKFGFPGYLWYLHTTGGTPSY